MFHISLISILPISLYHLDLSMTIFGVHKRASLFSLLELLCRLDDYCFQYPVYISTTSLFYSLYYSSLAVFLLLLLHFSSIVLLCFIYQCGLFVYCLCRPRQFSLVLSQQEVCFLPVSNQCLRHTSLSAGHPENIYKQG